MQGGHHERASFNPDVAPQLLGASHFKDCPDVDGGGINECRY